MAKNSRSISAQLSFRWALGFVPYRLSLALSLAEACRDARSAAASPDASGPRPPPALGKDSRSPLPCLGPAIGGLDTVV